MTFDRVLEPLARVVRSLMSQVDYLALYAAEVVAQNADGTLELKPDAEKIPGLSGVPIRVGIPGVTVTVSAGARVLVGFENGDPGKPFAALWEQTTATISFNGGTLEIARRTDSVSLGTFSVVAGVLNWIPPGGGATQTGAVAATGKITGGAANVKA